MGEMARQLKMTVVQYSDMEISRAEAPVMESWRYDKLAELLCDTADGVEDLSIELEILGFETIHQNLFKGDKTGKANEIIYMIWYAVKAQKFTGGLGDKLLLVMRKEMEDGS